MANPADTAEPADTVDSTQGVQAVVFALQILEHLATRKEAVRVTDLAHAFGTTKSRIFRHLRTLLQQGYIVQEESSERYRVGARLIALGQAVSANFELVALARDIMQSLRDARSHSVVLTVAAFDGAHVIALVPSMAAVEITVRPGSVLDFHSTAQGKLALAFGRPEWRARVQALPLPSRTPHTVVDHAVLQIEIDAVRQQGWAIAPNQAVIGLNALAAPVFDAGGSLAAMLAVVDSVQFITDPPDTADVQAVREAAAALSRKLGFKGTPMP